MNHASARPSFVVPVFPAKIPCAPEPARRAAGPAVHDPLQHRDKDLEGVGGSATRTRVPRQFVSAHLETRKNGQEPTSLATLVVLHRGPSRGRTTSLRGRRLRTDVAPTNRTGRSARPARADSACPRTPGSTWTCLASDASRGVVSGTPAVGHDGDGSPPRSPGTGVQRPVAGDAEHPDGRRHCSTDAHDGSSHRERRDPGSARFRSGELCLPGRAWLGFAALPLR